jgi:hypothetical protein
MWTLWTAFWTKRAGLSKECRKSKSKRREREREANVRRYLKWLVVGGVSFFDATQLPGYVPMAEATAAAE